MGQKRIFVRCALALAFSLVLGLCACAGPVQAPASSAAPAATEAPASQAAPTASPEPQPEYRAMWVSYLDWASFDFSSAAAFTADAVTLLDNCAAAGLNTVIAQVRPFGDALYPSRLFPWSHLCSGTQGQDPGFDPLAILVEQAHGRGLRIEAWVNPYRIALRAEMPGTLAGNSLLYTHPEWVKAVGSGGYYLDPASPEVQSYIVEGVREIVEGYEVDGIHFDDYFYPTTDPAFDAAEYAASGTALALEDWRRENVDRLVQAVYSGVKAVRPACRFGISPQGNNSNNYHTQYSDVARWLSTPGYVDYVMPQLYWGYTYTLKNGSTDFAFENIAEVWGSMPRHPAVALYAGLAAYHIGEGDGSSTDGRWQSGHILADMAATAREKGLQGFALFRYDFLFRSASWADLAGAEVTALAAMD